MISFRAAATVLALVAPLSAQAPASAEPVNDVALVTGTGSIYPGLPAEGCEYQSSITFSGAAQVVGIDYTGPLDVRFEGASFICETLGAGQGGGTLTGGVSGSVTYTRTGSSVTLQGSVTLEGTTRSIISAQCNFVPSPPTPITSYSLECKVVV